MTFHCCISAPMFLDLSNRLFMSQGVARHMEGLNSTFWSCEVCNQDWPDSFPFPNPRLGGHIFRWRKVSRRMKVCAPKECVDRRNINVRKLVPQTNVLVTNEDSWDLFVSSHHNLQYSWCYHCGLVVSTLQRCAFCNCVDVNCVAIIL